MALTTTEKLGEAFSLALEYRAPGTQDLVSNANAILFVMRNRGGFKTYSGPTIRVRQLYAETGSYTRYQGAQFLSPNPTDLFNDAEFTPKMGAVSMMLTGQEILQNAGSNQLEDVFEMHIDAAETELQDRFVEDLHSAGSSDNQIGGLQLAIPTTTSTGSYGGISRVSNTQWRTTTYNANSITVAGTAITAVTSTTIRPLFNNAVFARSRGKKGPDLLVCSTQHYQAYDAALTAIQRINDENGLGKGGFSAMKYYGAGKSIDVVLEGGVGSAMPDDVTYGISMEDLKFFYNPQRNFERFGGRQMPINQDAIVQHLGFMGEVVLKMPVHTFKIYDSSP